MAAAQQQGVGGKADDGQAGGVLGEAAALAAALAALQLLDPNALQRRWRALVGGAPPKGLGRPLTLRLLAYKLQAERLGDLDKTSRRELDAVLGRIGHKTPDSAPAAAASSTHMPFAAETRVSLGPARIVRPGTTLVREHGGVLQRVTVLGEGFSWNGRTYDSLTRVAFAITGTRWNGPRFFGLRDKIAKQASAGTELASPVGKQRAGVGGRPRPTVEFKP